MSGVSAQVAGAQVEFFTQGAFSGAGCTSLVNDAAASSCTVGMGAEAVTLTYLAVQEQTDGGNVSFGQFRTAGGTGLGDTFQSFANIGFAIEIQQTAPTVGAQMLNAQIAGDIRAGGGGLEWAPITPLAFMIGAVSYEVLVDDDGTNGIGISSPFNNGNASNPQTIRGSVNVPSVTVPEPSSMVLLVAGMAALGLVARRRGSAA